MKTPTIMCYTYKLWRYLMVSFLVLAFYTNYSQTDHSIRWLSNSKGDQWQYTSQAEPDKDGNVFMIGNFSGSLENNGAKEMVVGNSSVFVVGYRSNGELFTVQTINSKNYVSGQSIMPLGNGSLVVTGFFANDLHIGNLNLTASEHENAYVANLDTNGNVLWHHLFRASVYNPLVLAKDSQDFLLLGITFRDTTFIEDHTYIAEQKLDGLVVLLNSEGSLIHALHLKGSGDDLIAEVKLDSTSVYVAGSFEEKLNIQDTIIQSKGLFDAFMLTSRRDNGNTSIFSYGDKLNDYGLHCSITEDNNIIFSGQYFPIGSLSRPDQVQNSGKSDVFAIKMDDTEIVWDVTLSGPSEETINTAVINEEGDLLIAGNYRGSLTARQMIINSMSSSQDMFVAKFNTHGEINLLLSVGDSTAELARKLMVNHEGELVLTGNFESSKRLLNKDLNDPGNKGYFVLDLVDCSKSLKVNLGPDTATCASEIVLIADSGFAQYKWNGLRGNEQYTITKTGEYRLFAMDDKGCESVDTIMVSLFEPKQVSILGDRTEFFIGEVLELSTDTLYAQYNWSTGDTTRQIVLNSTRLLPGEHWVSVSVRDFNGCPQLGEFMIQIIENNSFASNYGLNIYPNPANNIIFVELLNIKPNDKYKISLVNMDGQVEYSSVISKNAFSETLEIDCQHLVNGIYLIIVESDGSVAKEKIEIF